MKNIHIIPTDKPSRLFNCFGKLEIGDYITTRENLQVANQNIYITNNEEIKEGDYCISHLNIIDEGKIHNSQTIFNPKTKEHLILLQSCKKIILTTDIDLIKNGVQAIDDEFLEWFVKNPSCEEVELKKGFADGTAYGYNFLDYKIIIPKEEYKQETHICKYCKAETTQSDDQCYAKPKQEKMYSEIELEVAFFEGRENNLSFIEWFEQFKKK